jgi:endogenous inhibitor of DNA gyrase (YacG/DUF329 family)
MKSSDQNAVNDNAGKAKCANCNAPVVEAYKPFCSKRCADVDLHRWLTGGYAIPAVDVDVDGERDLSDDDDQ